MDEFLNYYQDVFKVLISVTIVDNSYKNLLSYKMWDGGKVALSIHELGTYPNLISQEISYHNNLCCFLDSPRKTLS